RGRGRTANEARPPKHKLISDLSPQHYIFKAWLQYFRSIVLKLTLPEIASTLEVSLSTYRKWERVSPFLPPPYWFDLLWRWWTRCYMYIDKDQGALAHPSRLPLWSDITTTTERLDLIKQGRPRYFHQLDLKRKQSTST